MKASGQSAQLTSMSYEPLTPTAYLDRAASCHGDRVAVVDGLNEWTYEQLHQRSAQLAGALAQLSSGRPVAVLAPNSHVLLESHFGVPWSGSPLVALNTRLSASEIAYMLGHSEAAVLIYDSTHAEVVEQVRAQMSISPILVQADDGQHGDYEQMLSAASPVRRTPTDELSLLSVNYTSGTTGKPKGVMYSHRGAYLQALAMVGHTGLSPSAVYLWTLPMFHCNGWCFPWAVTAAAATHVCLRKVDPSEVWQLIRRHGVTHLNGAPTVLSMLAYAAEADAIEGTPVRVATGGAPPSPAILRRMAELGFDVTHLYGLTETYGPAAICDWRPEWDALDLESRAKIKARQGVANMISCEIRVLADDGTDVLSDGLSTGEIALRGNNVMLGYLHDLKGTEAAAPDGWFRTGDLGVRHPDGYIELRDRSKDVIISGGENIASVEVEQVIMEHSAVLEVAVIAVPDPQWGEVAAAYVALKPGREATAEDIIDHVRANIARFKAPKHVIFGDLPKTSTGKTQKYLLRERAWHDRQKHIQ
ncbi:acyl-CoA synthetase [Mycobacterium sp. Root265]|uniref:AMP-binding protein n=1 Tax=Mycobacterium sp. Root265 TaxID=1736504 RepID=UPI00070E3736|nr:AMP-binding protein [Mycobacterium sp. Root265]KRD05963.1 acyl-CoA synthetase [Mycobacterium sp. Root265]